MKAALWATAAMNVLGALAFVPAFAAVREAFAFPAAHPLYLFIGEFIAIFGVAYGWCAAAGRAPRVFIAVSAAGKLAFSTTLILFWLAGELPPLAVSGGAGDLVFGGLFLGWLVRSRRAGRAVFQPSAKPTNR